MIDFDGMLVLVARIFETVGARYAYVGSVASSNYGSPRSTNDIDLITDLSLADSTRFIQELGEDFYYSETSIRRALQTHKSFNLIRLELMLKVDVFCVAPEGFGQTCLARRSLEPPVRGSDEKVYMITAEDTVLAKLEWFKKGGGTSDRQWTDILGILKAQGTSLDVPYLRAQATELKITDLLERAFDSYQL